ncbi:MAG TPA: protoglobin domain-containing protein [Acidobacteriota bacterium]|jgi:signal transduction histidine kinase
MNTEMVTFYEIKNYLHFSELDIDTLKQLGPMFRPHLKEMADRFYAEIPDHPDAYKVFSGPAQIERLKESLQVWGAGLFSGDYGEDYARQRYQIGYTHVRIQLAQKYVISAMAVVREFLHEKINEQVDDALLRMQAHISIDKVLDLDLNLMCEAYFAASLQALTDINRRLEEMNQKLRESSQVKSEFLARTSHELRTPLSSILGFIRLVLDGLCETREEEMDLLNDAFQAAEHLLSIVNDLLDVARIEAGKLQVQGRPVDLRPILDQVISLTALQAQQKGIKLLDETHDKDLPRVWADPERLKQVIINIVGNAVKFTDYGYVTVRARSDDSFVRFEVIDTGIGIERERQRELFEKFKQVDSSLTRRHGGSGLGLAISKHLIETMGGAIELYSEGLGRGTHLHFTVPVWREPSDDK